MEILILIILGAVFIFVNGLFTWLNYKIYTEVLKDSAQNRRYSEKKEDEN